MGGFASLRPKCGFLSLYAWEEARLGRAYEVLRRQMKRGIKAESY